MDHLENSISINSVDPPTANFNSVILCAIQNNKKVAILLQLKILFHTN